MHLISPRAFYRWRAQAKDTKTHWEPGLDTYQPRLSQSEVSRSTFRLAKPPEHLWGGWEGHGSVLVVQFFSLDCVSVAIMETTMKEPQTTEHIPSVGSSCPTSGSISKGKTSGNQGDANIPMCLKPSSQLA